MLANAEEARWTAGREDSDAAAGVEVPIHDCKKPTCIHVDEIAGKSASLLPNLAASSEIHDESAAEQWHTCSANDQIWHM